MNKRTSILLVIILSSIAWPVHAQTSVPPDTLITLQRFANSFGNGGDYKLTIAADGSVNVTRFRNPSREYNPKEPDSKLIHSKIATERLAELVADINRINYFSLNDSYTNWGSRTISFEFTVGNNPPIRVGRGLEIFAINFPSTFLIPPGEHKVYPIRLDKWWDVGSIPKSTETLVSLKAIYEVPVTPEAATYHVWTGRLESVSYKFTLRQW